MKIIILVLFMVAGIYGQRERGRPDDYHYEPEPPKKNSGRQTQPIGKFVDYKPVTEFSWNLFKKSLDTSENVVLSPIAIQILLSYLSTAADGQTRKEIVDVIKFRTPNQLDKLKNDLLQQSENREFQFASFIMAAESLNVQESFTRDLASRDVDFYVTDFSKPEQVKRIFSKVVNDKTKNKIQANLPNISPATKMLLTNVLYFNAKWVFELENYGEDTFRARSGDIATPFLRLTKKLKFGRIDNLAEWVELPYQGRTDSMVIIKPNEGKNIDDLVNQLRWEDLDTIMERSSRENYANVSLQMPKFTLTTTSSLIKSLKDLGIKDLFSPHASLPKLSTSENLEVSDVQQQSLLEVNEKGTIAVSVTTFAVVALSYSPPVEDVVFRVDRPFIAMIVDKTNKVPLFLAKVVNP